MLNQVFYLGLSENIWQGIFGFISIVIVAGAVGIITIHWLSKREALNEREGKIINDRITAYLEILDSMARINERIVILDSGIHIRGEIDKHGIKTSKDRPVVEYPPFLEDEIKLHAIIKSLGNFYIKKLHLVGPKTYKQFTFIYLYLSKIDGYYKYLVTTPMPDGRLLDKSTTNEILKEFLPKFGMVIDYDLVKMQADFERALVGELYDLKSCTNPPLKNEAEMEKYFYKRFWSTLYFENEEELSQMLLEISADKTGTPFDILFKSFKANDYIEAPSFYEKVLK